MPLQSVFITGASSGIGLETAALLDSQGWRVFAGCLPGENLAALQSRITDRTSIIPIDVTRPEMVSAAAEAVGRAVGEGGLYGLVNNAGFAVSAPMEYVPMELLRQQFEVNFFGQVSVTQAFLPLIRRATGGRIINLCSILGRVTTPFSGPYCASKHAMESFTDALRLELAPWGIQVVAVEPGVIKTPIWKRTLDIMGELGAEFPPEARERYGRRFESMQKQLVGIRDTSSPPEEVAAVIHTALTAPQPRTRYLVGKDAALTARLRWLLPDRLLYRLIIQKYGLA
jgi:NAD(P)-dependent dehydrogenase (short-subunit alcohol dehydrogenase family)